MFVLFVVMFTGVEFESVIYNGTFSTPEACTQVMDAEVPNLPNVVYASCFEVPGETA
jgi:hypothetical protein